jgi:hypothetical protein
MGESLTVAPRDLTFGDISLEAARRLAAIEEEIEEERRALKKSLEAIDNKYKRAPLTTRFYGVLSA